MRFSFPALWPRSAALALALLAAGCAAGAPLIEPPATAPEAAAAGLLTLRIDPAKQDVTVEAPRALLARLEAPLHVRFDVTDVVQDGDATALTLSATNLAGPVQFLSAKFVAGPWLLSPANPVAFDALAEGAFVSRALRFANPSGAPFSVTIAVFATLSASGSERTDVEPPSPTPTPSPSPLPSTGLPGAVATPPVGAVPDPGPLAARGRVMLAGMPGANVTIEVTRSDYGVKRLVTTDASGYFTATGLPPGNYFAYYYNESDRNKIGFWRTPARAVSATQGAIYPAVDLHQPGMLNLPQFGTRVGLPRRFDWVPQTQTASFLRFRVHTDPGRGAPQPVFISNQLPADSTSYTWSGEINQPGITGLSATNRYFWGVYWSAGELGEGGNLYQAVYLNP